MKRLLNRLLIAAALVCWGLSAGQAQDEPSIPDSWANQINWRSIGPANMSGRITALTVYDKDPYMWWAATASGGLLKTTNNGMTFEHQFDRETTVSIGDVKVAQSDPNILYVGTGEANPRNSVSWGDGVYKSTDGGKTWKNVGLAQTFQIGRIAIHPENADVVYVGALGRLWGPNEERGLFKTTDGGKTWEKVLYVDDHTGVIDVQMNPANPDELIVATYERSRDGFDGNDPIKKYGAGSGIYKTTDGGKTFKKLTGGLPTVKMGRIGLEYYRADPKFVYAIIETEKIAQQPEDVGFAGLTGENVDAGTRVTDVTRNGPAAAAGLKEGDIILGVNDQLILSYEELLKELRKYKPDDVVKIKYSRERQAADCELKMAKRPATGGGRNPFTGTLGGQAENLQDQQGAEGYQYGGIYRSEDGGENWVRINTLNPRPMYYSQIRVDPSDNKNVYCLGTELYRSFDGGTTFKPDGVTSGIHVDFHALWVSHKDGRHMIIGCDGGVYMTHDRMASWDHLSHVAIGQFYHTGVDTRRNYRVYGGLQDNGSWGGPSRVNNGNGPVNSDWFSVGGGDGFVTFADPNDPDQVYFESQNGGMGRINIRTGERGFIRPQQEQGLRYRWDWKTPFLLSHHNSKIFYSAGNYVFRSVKKGDSMQRISPEITNSDLGAGSALTESPLQQGLLYVGTTDGALWVTKDDGANWEAIYHTPVKKEEEKKEEAKADEAKPAETAGQTSTEKAESKPETKTEEKAATTEKAAAGDPLAGAWTAAATGENVRGNMGNFEFTLAVDGEGKLSGTVRNRRGDTEITNAAYNRETGEFSFEVAAQQGTRSYKGKIKDGAIEGEINFGEGRMVIPFKATKKSGESSGDAVALSFDDLADLPRAEVALTGLLVSNVSDETVVGTWAGVIENENLPNGRIEFEIRLKAGEGRDVSGSIVSMMGELTISEGRFNAQSGRFNCVAGNSDLELDLEAKVEGNSMKGKLAANQGDMELEFVATRREAKSEGTDADKQDAEKAAADKVAADNAAAEKAAMEKAAAEKALAEAKAAEQAARAEAEKAKAAAAMAEAEAAKANADAAKKTETAATDAAAKTESNDVVSGKYTGNFVSDQFPATEITLELSQAADGKVTGKFTSQRGEGRVTGGKYDATAKTLELTIETERAPMTFSGKLENDQFNGNAEFGGGGFSLPFEMKRQAGEAKAADAATEKPAQTGDQESEKSTGSERSPGRVRPTELAKLVPGPRWVSSLEASRYRAGRVYMTLDGHRSNDDEPYVFVSEDFGKSWKSIRGNLPTSAGSTRVVREDIVNEDVLYLGCEFSAWFSVDRGATWTRFKGNLPTVAVHEFAQHVSSGEIVAATHGRSLWIADVTVLRQFNKNSTTEPATLYKPNTVVRWRQAPRQAESGTRRFVGQNPTNNAQIFYSLAADAQTVTVTVSDVKGDVLATLPEPPARAGLHMLEWNLRRLPPPGQQPAQGEGRRGGGGAAGGGAAGGGGRGFGGRGGGGPAVPLGTYLVTLTVDGKVFKQEISIIGDPDTPPDAVGIVEEEAMIEAFENAEIDD